MECPLFFFAILFSGAGAAKCPEGPELAAGWGELVPLTLSSLLN